MHPDDDSHNLEVAMLHTAQNLHVGRQTTGRVAAAFCAAAALISACARNTPPPVTSATGVMTAPVHEFDHVIVIVLENEDAKRVEAVPAMASLAREGASLRNYYAVAHPSYPNYLAMVSGHTFIDTDPRVRHDPEAYHALDFGDAQLRINALSIIDRLEAKDMSWNAFAEDYPEASATPARCDFRRQVGLYARKHLPFLSFEGFHTRPALCAHVRNLRWFRQDSLASYTYIEPNLVHDGHDAPLDSAVMWLGNFLRPMLADSALMSHTLIVVTFDEASNPLLSNIFGSQPNRIYTVLLGGMVQAGKSSDVAYSHYSLLRTIEVNFGLAPSLVPPDVVPIGDIWRQPQ